MEFRVLGPIEVVAGGERLALGSVQQRAVLALLALRAPEPVSVDRLIDELWGDRAPATAAHAIQVHVSALRKILRAAPGADTTTLCTRGSGYALAVDAERIDARRFERLLGQAQHASPDDPATARRRFEEALALWRGPALADLRGLESAEAKGRKLEELRALAIEGLIEARLAAGEHAGLIARITDLVDADPLREHPRRLLMLALYRSGRPAEALAAYRDACRALDEVGLQPGPELRRLEQAILRHDASLELPDDGPPAPRRSNIPAAAHALIGRTTELESASELLSRRDVRLVTLLGPGGSGKTRLALELAIRIEPGYCDGAWFVSLAPLTDPTLVVSEIARTLDVKETEGQPQAVTLASALSHRELLVVLDNFEHVLEAAPLVGQLLAAAPGLDVLVTSRAALRLGGEHRVEVPPLPLPEAAELFVARARAVRPETGEGPEEGTAVRRICRRLDGLPLALELAAARVALFGVQALDARLAQRLDLPEGARDLPDRQRTLRATIDWSYRLLSGAEQAMFRGLAPFAGGARLGAIESILKGLKPEPIDVVASLLDQSLLHRHDDFDGQPRFSMLDTIRQHAQECARVAGEADAAATLHAAYFTAFAREAERHIHTADQSLWLARLEADHDNLRGAFDHLVDTEPSQALSMAAALDFFWEIRGHVSEGRERLRRALDAETSDQNAAAKATFLAARLALLQGDREQAEPLLIEALRLARQTGEIRTEVQALTHLGMLGQARGDADGAIRLHEQALAKARRQTDTWTLRLALNNLGNILAQSGDAQRARPVLQDALQLARRLGEPFGTALTAGNLAELELARGEADAAEALIAECLQNAKAIDYTSLIAWALALDAMLALHRGERDLADARNTAALAALRGAYDAQTGPIALATSATLAAARGEALLAAQLWAAEDREIRTRNVEQVWLATKLRDEWLPETRATVDPAAWRAAWQAGTRLTPEQALELATTPSAEVPRM